MAEGNDGPGELLEVCVAWPCCHVGQKDGKQRPAPGRRGLLPAPVLLIELSCCSQSPEIPREVQSLRCSSLCMSRACGLVPSSREAPDSPVTCFSWSHRTARSEVQTLLISRDRQVRRETATTNLRPLPDVTDVPGTPLLEPPTCLWIHGQHS
ncbi:uncharacterized protein LY79DRAFT_298857 [Colletotrichum navitas]|uniref:Uncharacterized protein n=1 Tax=Colletotrichum navitas TaxID=681940 RepID=A0AAD8V3D4_9PEZI|nr:uncharacterized protein LY79DRAFT_298857 [Colletotrichum navitas]KAK1580613.1 hypothetical protein LY79DRAFT_298857 [Colletotrichum navitas]